MQTLPHISLSCACICNHPAALARKDKRVLHTHLPFKPWRKEGTSGHLLSKWVAQKAEVHHLFLQVMVHEAEVWVVNWLLTDRLTQRLPSWLGQASPAGQLAGVGGSPKFWLSSIPTWELASLIVGLLFILFRWQLYLPVWSVWHVGEK